jgi:hypothetical protein
MMEFEIDFLEDFDYDNTHYDVPITILCQYEFDEGDPHVGLNDSFEWSLEMYINGTFVREIQDELSNRDWNLVESAIKKDWEQYIKDEQNNYYY